jgi:hypothetical protein
MGERLVQPGSEETIPPLCPIGGATQSRSLPLQPVCALGFSCQDDHVYEYDLKAKVNVLFCRTKHPPSPQEQGLPPFTFHFPAATAQTETLHV